MKQIILFSLLLCVCFSSRLRAQTSVTIQNNYPVASNCTLKVNFLYYGGHCSGVTNTSNQVTINAGASLTQNLTMLSWAPTTPSFTGAPAMVVTNPCSVSVTVGACNPPSGTLPLCHPSCPIATVSYNSATATLSITP